MEELGQKRGKKGRPIPKPFIRGMMRLRDRMCIALEGPVGIGKTALLQRLPTTGYAVDLAAVGLRAHEFNVEMF
jgi:alpha-D-ribose 1-methylphosphonate 5-triphosphate synthase subunit PhnL